MVNALAAGATSVARSAKAKSPGQVVSDISRWPLMVGVVTSTPSGQRLDPRDTNVAVAASSNEIPYRAASHPRSRANEAIASAVGGASS